MGHDTTRGETAQTDSRYAGSPTDAYVCWLRDHVASRITPTQLAILIVLASYADWTDGRARPSVKTVAKKIGRCRGHTARLIKQLVAEGLIRHVGHYGWIKVWQLVGYDRFVPSLGEDAVAALLDATAPASVAPARTEQEPHPEPQPIRAAAPAAALEARQPVEPEPIPVDHPAVAVVTRYAARTGERLDAEQAAEIVALASAVMRADLIVPELTRLSLIWRGTSVREDGSPTGWWRFVVEHHRKVRRGPDEAVIAERRARAARRPQAVPVVTRATTAPQVTHEPTGYDEAQQRAGAGVVLAALRKAVPA